MGHTEEQRQIHRIFRASTTESLPPFTEVSIEELPNKAYIDLVAAIKVI
jgi:hypothetical protein